MDKELAERVGRLLPLGMELEEAKETLANIEVMALALRDAVCDLCRASPGGGLCSQCFLLPGRWRGN